MYREFALFCSKQLLHSGTSDKQISVLEVHFPLSSVNTKKPGRILEFVAPIHHDFELRLGRHGLHSELYLHDSVLSSPRMQGFKNKYSACSGSE